MTIPLPPPTSSPLPMSHFLPDPLPLDELKHLLTEMEWVLGNPHPGQIVEASFLDWARGFADGLRAALGVGSYNREGVREVLGQSQALREAAAIVERVESRDAMGEAERTAERVYRRAVGKHGPRQE